MTNRFPWRIAAGKQPSRRRKPWPSYWPKGRLGRVMRALGFGPCEPEESE